MPSILDASVLHLTQKTKHFNLAKVDQELNWKKNMWQ